MRMFLVLLLLGLVAGCTHYEEVTPAFEKGHYYVIQTTSFLFFSKNRVVEYRRVPEGPDKGEFRYVRMVLPLAPEDNPIIQQYQEEQKARKDGKEAPRRDDSWFGN